MSSITFAAYGPLSSESQPMDRSYTFSIYTLGGFAITAEGRPLKLQKKPLGLLRALIGSGGKDVLAAKLACALWPVARPEKANHTLETNLYRLRKLIGERCVQLRNGQLSLNTDCCWVDAWELERLLAFDEVPRSITQMRSLFDLYRGPFLPDLDTPPVLIQRERLRSKFLRAIYQFGGKLESLAEYRAAIECYQKGIEADPLAEELHRRLMCCYYECSRPAEALSVYLRFRATLISALGVEPTRQTTALYHQIQAGGLSGR